MMSSIHLLSLLLTLAIYTFLVTAYLGWGKITFYLLGLKKEKNYPFTLLIWMGWAFTLLIFQLFHFIFPLKAIITILVFLVGVAFAVPYIFARYRYCAIRLSSIKLLILVVILLIALLIFFWVASHSMLPPTNYDSGLYHFNKIRWINIFPIVPGLGNLHGRFAFNQSFFAYAAALNFYPYFGYGRSIANSFLFLLTVATFVELLRPVFKQPSRIIELSLYRYVFILFLFPCLIYLALSSDGLSSPSPDLTSKLLQLVMIIVLAQGLGEWNDGSKNQNYKAIFLGLMAVTAVTVKLSNLAFCLVIMLFVLLYAVSVRNSRPAVIRTIALSVFIVLVWCVQSVIFSGAPLYPSTISYFSLEWAVPMERVNEEAKWVYSWARLPNTHWRNVLGNWDWFKPWINRISENITAFIFPMAVSLFFCVATAVLCCFKKIVRPSCLNLSILAPSIAALVFWFFVAPDLRFANALFFIIPISSVIIFLLCIKSIVDKRMFIIVVCTVFVTANCHFAEYAIKKREDFKSVSVSGWHPIKKAALNTNVTSSGILVYTPQTGDQCWDSPLPCTPNLYPDLRMRKSKDMSSGFTIKTE